MVPERFVVVGVDEDAVGGELTLVAIMDGFLWYVQI
jgi:hypothetical protein